MKHFFSPSVNRVTGLGMGGMGGDMSGMGGMGMGGMGMGGMGDTDPRHPAVTAARWKPGERCCKTAFRREEHVEMHFQVLSVKP